MTLDDHEVSIHISQNYSFSVLSTPSYHDIFDNDSTLIFQYSVPADKQIYIEPLQNISLGENFTSALVTLIPLHAGRLVISSKIEPPVQNYTWVEDKLHRFY